MAAEEDNKANVEAFIRQMGWQFLENDTQYMIWRCPFCGKDKNHFYVNRFNGMWDCKKCGQTGNFNQLQTRLGVNTQVASILDRALAGVTAEALVDCYAAHARLMEDAGALSYLITDRGLDTATIETQRLGLIEVNGVRHILIPYFKNNEYVYYKSRSIPPADRAFHNAKGREVPLFNEDAVDYADEYIILVEGEMDAITLIMHGFKNVVGIPGANMRKWSWIDRLIARENRKIVICYDSDKTGQQAARDMASKIGLDRAFNLALPAFTTIDGKPGKDVNEWFRIKHTREEFQKLLDSATLFEVQHTTTLPNALTELEEDFAKTGGKPPLVSPWPSLNERLGGMEWGDLIGIIAEGKVGKSTLALNWLDYYNKLGCQGHSSLGVFFYCLEMPPKRLAKKWASMATSTADNALDADSYKLAKKIALEREQDFLFAYHRPNDVKEVYEVIRQVVTRNGVKVVAFDNLQMLVKDKHNTATEISILSKAFKQLALELNIVILLIIQPNRVAEGEMVGARNSWGSSAIEKDCDAIIALHRQRVMAAMAENLKGYIVTNETFEPQMRVDVNLSRYSSGGICELWFDGACSTVREYTEAEANLAKGIEAAAEAV